MPKAPGPPLINRNVTLLNLLELLAKFFTWKNFFSSREIKTKKKERRGREEEGEGKKGEGEREGKEKRREEGKGEGGGREVYALI